MNTEQYNDLKKCGYVVLPQLINSDWILKLSKAINDEFSMHRNKQISNQNDINTDGVALHVILGNKVFIEFVEHLIEIGFVKNISNNFFKSNCILNSFSALNNLPNVQNFSAVVHRDLRFYTHGLPVMVNCLLMIDDFTNENGGTLLLPYSHLEERKPSDEEFFEKAVQINGKSGDMLIFDSNVWHASAYNKTENGRRAIPITISRSFLKQLLDYPRALGYDKIDDYGYELQQFLGYHARVPASLDEWYQPEDKRFYKKNQD